MMTRITSLALAAALATGIASGAGAAQGDIDKASYASNAVPAFGAAATATSGEIRRVGEKAAHTPDRPAFGVQHRGGTDVLAWVGEKNHGGRHATPRAGQLAATPAR